MKKNIENIRVEAKVYKNQTTIFIVDLMKMPSLFQALRWRASEEKNEGGGAEESPKGKPVRLFLMDRFWYTSSWYTL